MTSLGYIRVSTQRQSLDQQTDALLAAGVDPTCIYSDKMSGAREDRPGLAELLGYAREGDSVTVVALDRLGRSVPHVMATMADLQERGIILKSLRENVDFGTAVGKVMAGIFMHLAEYERTLIAERTEAARQAARDRGRQVGRPAKLTADQVRQARALRASGESISAICTTLSVSRATLYRALDVADYTTQGATT